MVREEMLRRTKPKLTTLGARIQQRKNHGKIPLARAAAGVGKGRDGEVWGILFLCAEHPQPPAGSRNSTASCALPLLAPPRPAQGGDGRTDRQTDRLTLPGSRSGSARQFLPPACCAGAARATAPKVEEEDGSLGDALPASPASRHSRGKNVL